MAAIAGSLCSRSCTFTNFIGTAAIYCKAFYIALEKEGYAMKQIVVVMLAIWFCIDLHAQQPAMYFADTSGIGRPVISHN